VERCQLFLKKTGEEDIEIEDLVREGSIHLTHICVLLWREK
jgi:hypothetical protein